MSDLITHLEAAGLHPIVIDENTNMNSLPQLNLKIETHSQYLPKTNIQYAWDSTSLGDFKRCPRYYQYSMLEGWRSREDNIHLRFGTEYHHALENYDHSRAAGLTHKEAVRDVVQELMFSIEDWDPDPDSKAGQFKNRHSLVRTVIWYLEKYRDDPATTFIKADGKPAVEQSFRFELDWGPTEHLGEQPYLLCGHLDRVVTFNDEIFVMDRKTTTKTLGDYYFNQYEPDNQMTLYTLASKVILDAPVKGVIIDAAQVAIGFSRFVRSLTYRSTDQLEEWLTDLRRWLSLAKQYADDGYWPQNDTACDKYGGCRFREICSKSPSVRKQFLKANFKQQEPENRWNPLKIR